MVSMFRGRRIRTTRVDSCGRPIIGGGAYSVSKGFVSLSMTTNTTESDAIEAVTANGEQCVYEGGKIRTSGYAVEANFCDVDFEMFSLITGQEVYRDSFGKVIGISEDTQLSNKGFGLEIWVGATGSGTSCEGGGGERLGYILLPFVEGGYIGDISIENSAITFTVTGANTKPADGWGVGPYRVLPGATADAEPLFLSEPLKATQSRLLLVTTVPAPDPFVGTRALFDPDATEITAFTVSATDLVATIGGTTPTNPNTGYEIGWGDGSYDYIAAGLSSLGHVYEKSGIYDVTLSSNGIDTVERKLFVGTVPSTKSAVRPSDIFPADPNVVGQNAANAGKLLALGYASAEPAAWTTGQSFSIGAFVFSWDGTAFKSGAMA